MSFGKDGLVLYNLLYLFNSKRIHSRISFRTILFRVLSMLSFRNKTLFLGYFGKTFKNFRSSHILMPHNVSFLATSSIK